VSTQQTMNENEVSAKNYVKNVYETVAKRNTHKSEFHQAIKEIIESLEPVFAKHPKYMQAGILERIVPA
jgi:glutamate dehydrogenase (NADP+)